MPPCDDPVEDGECQLSVGSRIQCFGGIGHSVEVVRCEGAFFSGGGGGDDFKSPVKLKSIGIDNLTAELPCEGERVCGLARGGWAAEVESLMGGLQV